MRTTNDAGMPGWHAGWTQGDDETAYLGVEQTPSRDQTSDTNWLAAQVGSGRNTGTRQIAGRDWRRLSPKSRCSTSQT